ncbi:hypothetical protein [Hymenobacter sp. B1770]|uniref:hypothetical protein n=1 Tax=Hymenobacter sp. B1770 TaxID=1718788 RepID=UPI003CEF041F
MKLLFPLLLLISTALSSCNIDKCEGALDATHAHFSLQYLAATGNQSLFSSRSTTYFRDSVRITDEQGSIVATDKSDPVSFRLFKAGETLTLGQPTTRRFLIYLSRTDQDTIQAEFKLFRNDCKNPQFEYASVFYNGKRLNGDPNTELSIVIRKP